MRDDITIKGEVSIRGYNEQGEQVLAIDKNNLVVTVGKGVLAAVLRLGTTTQVVNGIAFGTRADAPVLGDTAITGAFTKSIVSSSNPVVNQAQFNWALEYAENNGMTIRELGLIVDRTGTNTLFSRITTAAIIKTSSLRLEGSWKITF